MVYLGLKCIVTVYLKVINPKPKIKIKKISQSISHINANDSIGFVAADIGIKVAIKNAKKLVLD